MGLPALRATHELQRLQQCGRRPELEPGQDLWIGGGGGQQLCGLGLALHPPVAAVPRHKAADSLLEGGGWGEPGSPNDGAESSDLHFSVLLSGTAC